MEVIKFVKDIFLCVHECEKDEYVEVYGEDRVVVMGDDLKGNMAKVRNFIVEKSIENGDDVCVLMDDDVKSVGYYENMEMVKVGFEEMDWKLRSL